MLRSSRSGSGLEARMRTFNALERAFDGRGGPKGNTKGAEYRLRMLSADAARIHDDSRLDLICESGITPSALKALHALFDLSINTYSSVSVIWI